MDIYKAREDWKKAVEYATDKKDYTFYYPNGDSAYICHDSQLVYNYVIRYAKNRLAELQKELDEVRQQFCDLQTDEAEARLRLIDLEAENQKLRQGQWVKVSDDMPESGVCVLGYWEEKIDENQVQMHMKTVCYIAEMNCWVGYENDDELPVTYWMLPEPPRD